jgi:2-phospho-L-lactate transferase/gluconeogenesis factor (CofD/UPF0052 family)
MPASASRIEATIADNRMRNVATAGGAFLYLGSFDDSNLIIQGFDRNLVRGEVNYGLYMDERDTRRIRVDGTLNPAATNEVIDAITDVLFVPNNPPAGSFFMNGVQVDLP